MYHNSMYLNNIKANIFRVEKKLWCGQELINGLARPWNKLGKYETI